MSRTEKIVDKCKNKMKRQAEKVKKLIAFRKGKKKADKEKTWDKDPNVRERLDTFYNGVLDRPTQELLDEFEKMGPKPYDLKLMKGFDKHATKGRNRFNHIGCWEESRVKLTMGPVDYIHANFISTPKHPQRIIATQAPLDKTCADFWYMVLQEQPDIIIGLCQLDEKNKDEPVPVKRTPSFLESLSQKIFDSPKEAGEGTICSQYFPLEQHDTVEFNDGEIVVTCTDVKKHAYLRSPDSNDKTKVIERSLSITVNGAEKWHVCRHYHWIHNNHEAWKFNSVPMHFLENLPATDKPIVMQCRDGVCLTGAFVMFQYYLDLLETDCEVLPPLPYLKEMRDQRHNFLAKWKFFYYVHMVMLRYFWEKTNKDHDNYRAFSSQYSKEMQKFNLDQ